MKTTRLIFIALLSFMAAQCSTDEMQPAPDTDPGSGTVNLTLRSAATDTRTSLAGDGSVEWSPDDNVWVNGQMYFVLPDGNDPTKATVENVASAVDFLASFPDEPLMRDNGSYGVYIRENQTYSENSFGPSDNPMIAYSTSTDLQFRNIGGVVRIAVRGSQSVGNVAFIANDLNPAAGYLMIPAEDIQTGALADEYSDFDGADNGYERIYLGTGEPVTLSSSATTFDFVVAPRTPQDTFLIHNGRFHSSPFDTQPYDRFRLRAAVGARGVLVISHGHLFRGYGLSAFRLPSQVSRHPCRGMGQLDFPG